MTPMTLLGLSSVALVLGIALAWWGRRGRVIDAHPVCRKCRFDLVGRPPGSDRCPECGADLHWPRAIVVGNRKPRHAVFVIGGSLALLAVCVFGGWQWVQFRYADEAAKPTWLVLLDAGSNDAIFRSAALSVLFGRQMKGQLSASQINAYVDRLGAALRSNDVKEQTDALTSLTILGSAAQRAIPALAASAGRPDPDSLQVTFGLGNQGPSERAAQLLDHLGPAGQAALEREVKGGSPQALKNWLHMGKRANDPRIAQLLLSALNSQDRDLSNNTDYALDNWPGSFPSGPALAALKDSHPNTRIKCLSLLGKLDKHPPLDVLQQSLHDSDADVKSAAIVALTKCYQWTDDPRAQQWLIDVLIDLQSSGRLAAADALYRYRAQGSINALRVAMKDQDQDISTVAICSLERIGSEAALNAIMDDLDDLRPDRQKYAEQVADRMAHGSYKNTPYWKKHEAAKYLH